MKYPILFLAFGLIVATAVYGHGLPRDNAETQQDTSSKHACMEVKNVGLYYTCCFAGLSIRNFSTIFWHDRLVL